MHFGIQLTDIHISLNLIHANDLKSVSAILFRNGKRFIKEESMVSPKIHLIYKNQTKYIQFAFKQNKLLRNINQYYDRV